MMKPEIPIFHIKNLECAYDEHGRTVLNIQELIIPKGKLVFLLGSSGSGKSTLLETLGLMNNTIRKGRVVFSHPAKDGSDKVESYDLTEVWKGKEKQINQLRKQHFSFIFQQTNLMENFTAYENVGLSEMIRTDIKLSEAVAGSKDLMARVNLSQNEVGLTKMPVHLSGGQRQRLSFVRALSSSSDVLFCDEPTGNLDESNANELFEVIKEAVSKGKTAIIVSHDIDLALQHADIIVVLTKNEKENYGEVKLENIIENVQQINKEHSSFENYRKRIIGLFNSKEVAQKTNKEDGQAKYLNYHYSRLFRTREFQSLMGKMGANFIILTVISLLTFLALGFANGSLNYLKNKMDSALVNWVNVKVPATKAQDREILSKTKDYLQKSDLKEKFQYSTISPFTAHFDLLYKNDGKIIGGAARTVDPAVDNKLIEQELLTPDNLIVGESKGFSGEEDFSVILSERFLKDFGYSSDITHVNFDYKQFDPVNSVMQDYKLPMPIKAIVKQLPGDYLIYYNYTYHCAVNQNDNDRNLYSMIIPDDKVGGIVFEEDSTKYTKLIADISNDLKKLNSTPFESDITPTKYGYKKGIKIRLNYADTAHSAEYLNRVWSEVAALPSLKPYSSKILRIYFPKDNIDFSTTRLTPDGISVFFKKLDYISEFKNMIDGLNDPSDRQEDRFSVDLTLVKNKKNFLFLSRVATSTSIILIIFSIVTICLFLYNLISSHLNKVKMNIGTFKATGLSNMQSIRIYFIIVLAFSVSALASGFALALASGIGINSALLSTMKVDDGVSYFHLFELSTLFTVTLILVASILVSRITIGKILSKTPGDLIYNR